MKPRLSFPGRYSGAALPGAKGKARPVLEALVPLILFCFWTAHDADAKSYETKKTVANYEVYLTMEKNPPIIGENPIEIGITDGAGKSVTDARVLVNYYMPPMPRMAPMNYTTEAPLKKQKYRAAMKFIMAGPWYIAVKIHHGGKIMSVKINVDAQ